MKKIEIVPSSIEHINQFLNTPPKYTIKSWTALLDGEAIGIAGFTYGDDCITVFSTLTKEIKRYRKQLWRTAKMIISEADKLKGNLMAIADPKEPTASRFLEKLGFKYVGTQTEGEVYQWN